MPAHQEKIDQIARVIDPVAWRTYDGAMAPFLNAAEPVEKDAIWVNVTLRTRENLTSAEAVDAWFRVGKSGSHGGLSMHQQDLQQSLRKAEAISVLTQDPREWRPIETGPKDATTVEVIDFKGAISRARYLANFGGGRWCFVAPSGVHVGKAYGLKAWRPRV